MITLCYVKGINEVDTPYFSDKNEQTAFFDKTIVWRDEESYYPPYFMNTIRLSSEDIPFNNASKKVNYCFLDYEGKRYYYFIDSIDYVTDDLVEITIEMDTIQTYWYDILVTKPTISRMAINRWGDGGNAINRNYIRENLSTGNMIKRLKEEFKGTSDKLKWIVVRISDNPNSSHYDPNNVNPTLTYLRSSSYGHVRFKKDAKHFIDYQMTGGGYLLIPYGDWVAEAGKVWVEFGDTFKLIEDIPTLLSSLASDSRVMSMSFIPFNPFADIHYIGMTHTDSGIKAPLIEVLSHGVTINTTDSEGNPITMNLKWYYYELGSTASSASRYGYFKMVFPEDYNNRTESFTEAPAVELIPNSKTMALDDYVGWKVTTKTTTWNSANVPAMLDENYLQVHLGDNGGTTIAPLFYYVIPSLSMDEWATLDGNMAYSIASTNVLGIGYGGAIIDMNNTALMNENSLTFDLYTDPWKNYQVTHKGSLVTDWISTGANSVAKIAGVTSLAEATMGRSKGTAPMSYSDMNLSVGDYVTGFIPYRKHVYSTRGRDPKTGRFIRNEIFTYTGGL
nr:MAG TPA: Major tail protein [Caudoviricetes sp.]